MRLRDGLRVVMVLRDRDLNGYPRAAARWAASFIRRWELDLADAQLAIAALQALGVERPVGGGQALEVLLEQHGEHQAAADLSQWLRAHED